MLFSVDLGTGAATPIASTANNGLATPADLVWRSDTQELWTVDVAGGEAGTIDVVTGVFTAIHQTGLSGWQGMALTADLYYMAGHWALRLWFFWLDKGVARRPQTQGKTVEERRIIERWSLEQEIPDAERVDLVFDKDFNLVYLCTDLHWHEMWAPYENQGQVLQVSIAAAKKLEVIIRGAAGVKIIAQSEAQKRLPDPDRQVIPSDIVLQRLRNPHQAPQEEGSITHKHTPYFHEVEFDAELTSSDVLKG
jgi:hypothetical protein